MVKRTEWAGTLPASITVEYTASMVLGGFASSFLPAVNISAGDWSFGISPSIAFGNAVGMGVNFSASYSDGNFSISGGYGFSYFGSAHGTGASGWEHRKSWAFNWDDGRTGFGVYSTSFSSGETSQRIGGFNLRSGDFGLRYENDGAPLHGILGNTLNDGGDRYRTAAARLSYGDFNLTMNLYTGDYATGHVNPQNISKKYPNSYYEGGNVDAYRFGGLTFGYGNYNFGINSERIRHGFQNVVAHQWLAPQPAFLMLGRSVQPYFQYRTNSIYTLW